MAVIDMKEQELKEFNDVCDRILEKINNIEKMLEEFNVQSTLDHYNQIMSLHLTFEEQLDYAFKIMDEHPEYKLQVKVIV
jgi:hypothetical protein